MFVTSIQNFPVQLQFRWLQNGVYATSQCISKRNMKMKLIQIVGKSLNQAIKAQHIKMYE